MSRIFVIETKNTHYVLGVNQYNMLRHIHWGKKARNEDYEISRDGEKNSNHSELDYATEEYSPFGGTRYRACALKCEFFDKCRDTVLTFKNAEQSPNELKITLEDTAYSMEVVLTYLYSDEHDVITRYATIINRSEKAIKIERMMSAELTLPGTQPYDIINTNGSWGAEFLTEQTTLKNGTVTFESKRGTAGHNNSPFIILSQNATEDFGNVYYAALGYGGNFTVEASRDFVDRTRAMLGISDFDFEYILKAGEAFTTPKVYIGFANGFAQMSNTMNRFAVENILPEKFAKKPLPVLYNSWEATGFDVSSEGQLKLAKIAKDIGCELFVMDDGWFGERKDDHAGLGDWYVNETKFPNGIGELIDGVNALGMDFGLWFEPEMVNADSNLYRAHPDWTYHYDTRTPSELRNQRVLNITRNDVKQYVFDCMDKMLCKYNIKYIKWDMNRPFSEIGAYNLENQKELWIKHTQTVYEIADRLKAKHPDLQLEACASGGGRAEYGAMEHFDMVWTSDNTDPVDRLDIQRGFSLLYPIKCMRAWVTEWNKSERPVSLDYRFNVSMQGSLSIGANLLKYSDEEIETCKKYIAMYKEYRELIQFGNFYRLNNYNDDGFYATQYVSTDKAKSILFINANANSFFNKQFKTVSLKGLEENCLYKVKTAKDEYIKSGAYLMNTKKDIRLAKPLSSEIWTIEKI